jgi:hypothetical protein
MVGRSSWKQLLSSIVALLKPTRGKESYFSSGSRYDLLSRYAYVYKITLAFPH